MNELVCFHTIVYVWFDEKIWYSWWVNGPRNGHIWAQARATWEESSIEECSHEGMQIEVYIIVSFGSFLLLDADDGDIAESLVIWSVLDLVQS